MKVRPLTCPRCGQDLIPVEGSLYRCSSCGLNAALDFTSVEGENEAERAAILERDKARAERDKARFERDKERAERDRIQASCAAEMHERQLEYEKDKDRKASVVALACMGILVLIVLFCAVMASAPKIGAYFSGDIAVPASSDELRGISRFDAEQRFKDAGFTNVECVGMHDLNFMTGIFIDGDSVESVVINGVDSFDSSAYYPADAAVRITYHSYPD